MPGNTFGTILKLTTFGESHGKAVGGILDGFPAGVEIDEDFLKRELARRKPGQSELVSQRKEEDEVEILSGIFEGRSLGTPIAFLVWNKDKKPEDYDHLKTTYRPSHADFTYSQKYGLRDYRGGGRASARETVARVIAGSFAKMLLREPGITITAYVSAVGSVAMDKPFNNPDMALIDASPVRCPDQETSSKMIDLIKETAKKGDTLGGQISCVVHGAPAGLGEPVFDKLHADLGKAMLSINAVKGFEIGSGFAGTRYYGSQQNDEFTTDGNRIITKTNNSGGVQGGISNGMDIGFNVGFKPVSTLMKDQKTVDEDGHQVILEGKGRHDVTVVPRAVPIVEAMAALVIADHWLRNQVARV
ncbi:MAG TPA: chorismate synthase [Bacteroidetes bacterium]|nr:chorismate synthase [Bacteroidota bacterium]